MAEASGMPPMGTLPVTYAPGDFGTPGWPMIAGGTAPEESGGNAGARLGGRPNLHGAPMLIHGAIDESVNMPNTIQFADEMQKAQKPFWLMPPDRCTA
jgi:hypothetical protein